MVTRKHPISSVASSLRSPTQATSSSRPTTAAQANPLVRAPGYDKVTMATDLHDLLTKHVSAPQPIHVVGHDIGGMVAHAYAARFAKDTASVAWGECPLPGTKVYDRLVKELAWGGLWHFIFHWQIDVPEALTEGRERAYIKSFYDRLCHTTGAISPADVDHYASLFSQPGAMRAGFDVYRGFHQDAEDNQAWLEKEGKCKVPSLSLNGKESFLASVAREEHEEMYESVEVAEIEMSGHWCAEENPEGFVKSVLEWVGSMVLEW